MAGHSKWANTKFRKATQDQKRGKLFTKFVREITIATKQGGADPNLNPRLRSAIDKALSGYLTKDAIERAIKRTLGGEEKDLTEITYEGYGPHGIAVMAYCLTDNHTRTVSNIRHFFNKNGGNLGVDGSVGYLFTKKGQIFLPSGLDLKEQQVNDVMETAINFGATDFEVQSEGIIITCDPKDLSIIKSNLENLIGNIQHAEIANIANNYIKPDTIEAANKIMEFLEGLEELEDVQEVYSNADLSNTE